MTFESREAWARAAAGWEARADAFARVTMPVSTWMVDAVAPQPGQTILDLAAGLGDTGFLAAELIRPAGTLICSDLLPEMLSAAQRRAEALGIDNVRFRQMDANLPLDQPAASLDAVLCRWGYMLLNDGEAALRETRRVLRQDGRVALAAWTGAEDNRWSAAPLQLLIDRGVAEMPGPEEPSQFAWAAEGVVAERLEAAGFVDYDVQTLDFQFRYRSATEWWQVTTSMSVRAGTAAAALDAAARAEVLGELERVAEPYTADDGSLTIPARTWVAAATA